MTIRHGVELFALLALAIGACSGDTASPGRQTMDAIAESYVKLVLALGRHDAAYVDAYYGPPEWKGEAERQKLPLGAIDAEAARLLGLLGTSAPAGADELTSLRQQYLRRQLESLRARAGMLSGARHTFDEESRLLYDATAPVLPESAFKATLDELSALLPGEGTLISRYDAFRRQYVIPANRLGRVFDLAIAECRRRTLPHVSLPEHESFTVEYVRDKSWSGYNWYQGNYRSLIQVNTDLPIYIDRAVDLACHEGYPGHHVYNALLEKNLMRDRGWVEVSVYALFSPQSLIAEGTANYGIEVAFPDGERQAFERDVLFPAAGLNPEGAEAYGRVLALIDRLSYAGNEAARQYLNGSIDRRAAADWLTRFAMMSPERAEQRTRFMDEYRAYVINYNLGKDLVKAFIESRGGTESDPAKRWDEFVRLLGSPRLPSGLEVVRSARSAADLGRQATFSPGSHS
jgi:hypothetical protein